ncbi:hypothetical protein BD289DRAFT_428939 [Coniella lustricola]|uniref:DUF1917-domain-containing protein n=1 Tax=Coniella lustricola TaxID=2025994 RepID=A0A2T3ADF3_9PEZI|nr:hypothetical protein BD289DRAFT_428939 [Coniella lustricola]
MYNSLSRVFRNFAQSFTIGHRLRRAAPRLRYRMCDPMDIDSDFYGDEDDIRQMEDRLAAFDPASYWNKRYPAKSACSPSSSGCDGSFVKREPAAGAQSASLSRVVPTAPAALRHRTAALKATITTTTPSLHNPYEGRTACAKQLNESIDTFLARLPPSRTNATDQIPWIYIANPYIPRADRGSEEAPEEFGADVQKLVEGGALRLEMFGDMLREVHDKAAGSQPLPFGSTRKGPSRAAVSKELEIQKAGCVNDLLMLAKALKVRTGKWMLFIPPEHVDDVWATVALATIRNELGVAAKVAPRDARIPGKEHLICIYTYDFSDREDVARVLSRLKEFGLVRTGPGQKQIYYKADAYTYLGIASQNPWGLRASMYSSNEIFAYIKDRPSIVAQSVTNRDKGKEALEKVIKQEEENDGGGWTF